jgi:CheY-like chemotaxis protein
MVKQMTELLGGTVAVASEEGEGACFAAWVPLRRSAKPASTERRDVWGESAAAFEGHQRVALVVEDDDEAAVLVRIILEAEGFSVLRASSAEEALALAPQTGLDLMTLNTQLPGIDGLPLLAGIREDPALGKVPVVLIPANADGPLACTDAAAAVLQKPISRAALKQALTTLGFYDAQDLTRTVLVVDDDPKSVELIATYLPPPVYTTVRAYSGREAILLAKRVQPDLILLDLMMPHVTGFDVVQELQDDPSTAGIPILVVTAREITSLDRQVLNADPRQVVRIIEKAGFNRTDFMAEVRRALHQD